MQRELSDRTPNGSSDSDSRPGLPRTYETYAQDGEDNYVRRSGKVLQRARTYAEMVAAGSMKGRRANAAATNEGVA